MSLTREERIAHRKNVVTNGGVFDRSNPVHVEIVKAFDDDTLERLSDAATERVQLTANAKAHTCNNCGNSGNKVQDSDKPAKKKKTKVDMKPDPEEGTVTGNSQQTGRSKDWDEWLASAPPEAREVWNSAVDTAEKHKAAVILQLVANVKDEDRRKALTDMYAEMPVAKLELMADSQPQTPPPGFKRPNYSGAAGAVHNNRMQSLEVDQDDLEPMPTFEALVKAEKNGKHN